MLRQGWLLLLLAALVASSGCISQQLSIEERLACVDLTSKAFAFVPECSSQEECFGKLDSALFGFDESVFSAGVATELYYYKNNVALSWLYFNKARSNISAINKICSQERGHDAILHHLNELNHNLQKAFEFSDAANKKAFVVLLLEKRSLQEQDIELIKEEPIFSDFIEISNNLSQLDTKTVSWPDSFAGFYLQQLSDFTYLAELTGFSERIVAEYTAVDLLDKYDEKIASKLPRDVFFAGFIVDSFSSLVDYFNRSLKLGQTAQSLRHFPAFQFLQSYNNFMGTRNSTLSRFSALMGGDALNREQLNKSNALLYGQISGKLADAEKQIAALADSFYGSIDSNFFAEIYLLLGQGSEITTQAFSIQSLRNFEELAYPQFFELGIALQKANGLSLGGKTEELKRLNNELDVLQQNIQYLSSDVLSGLDILCKSRVSLMQEELSQAEFPAEFALKLTDLKSRALFQLNSFNSSKEQRARLLYCKQALEEFSKFKTALADFQGHSASNELSLQECISSLGEILASSSVDLSDFAERFRQIKELQQPYDFDYISRFCSRLHNDVIEFLKNSPDVLAVTRGFQESKRLFSLVESVSRHYPKLLGSSKLEKFESSINSLQQFFDGAALDYGAALPLLPELQQRVKELNSDLGYALQQAIVDSVSDSYSVDSVISNAATASGFETKTRITFSNQFPYSVEFPVYFSIPVEGKLGELAFSSGNVVGVRQEGKVLFIDLNSLPRGETVLDFVSVSQIEVEEFLSLKSVSESRAAVEKTLVIRCSQFLPKLLVETTLIQGLSAVDVTVLSGSREIQFTMNNNMVSFELLDVDPGHSITVYFSVLNPVLVEKEFLAEKALDFNCFEYWFALKARNLLPLTVKKADLKLELFPVENELQDIELLKENGEKHEFSILSGGLMAFSLSGLIPGQQEDMFLVMRFKKKQDVIPEVSVPEQALEEAESSTIQEQLHLAQQLSQQIAAFKELEASAMEKLGFLEQQFNDISEEELIEAQYIPPISENRLGKLRLQLDSINSSSLQESISSFSDLVRDGNYDAAIQLFQKSKEAFEQKEKTLQSIDSELTRAIDAIKEDSISAFNSAVSFYSENSSGEAEQKPGEARSAIENSQLLKSIALSKGLVSTTNLEKNKSMDLPVFLYPVIGAVALVSFVRMQKRKKSEKKQELVKRITRNW